MIDVSYFVVALGDLAAMDEARRGLQRARRSLQRAQTTAEPELALKRVTPGLLSDLPPRHVTQVEATIRDPGKMAIRNQVREIGWQLSAEGGREAMEAALNDFQTDDTRARFAAVIDKVWDRIGTGEGGRWFA